MWFAREFAMIWDQKSWFFHRLLMLKISVEDIRHYLLHLQKNICTQFNLIDGKSSFRDEYWSRDTKEKLAGDGLSCIIEDGAVFEKVGVNFSHVQGKHLPLSARASRHLPDAPFEALGLSLVAHPDNPYVPTSHMNVRFFSSIDHNHQPVWWFGGGFDLTPYYGFTEDCVHWHSVAKKACDPFGEEIYPELKRWCDEYFFIKHRQEPRGIGGLFFDDWNRWEFEKSFSFMKSIGNAFLDAYIPIVQQRKNIFFTDREKIFQKIRRGRYVEFNLVYDRGTLFGLQSGGRTESILMSLPKEVSWIYDYQPESGSIEERLTKEFLVAKDWVIS